MAPTSNVAGISTAAMGTSMKRFHFLWAAALAHAIRKLAGDGNLAQRLSRGGRAAYRQRASEAVLGPRWRGMIAELL